MGRLGDDCDIVALANPTPLLLNPPLSDEVEASPPAASPPAEGASRNCCLLVRVTMV